MKIGAYHIFSLVFLFSAVAVGAYTYIAADDLQEEVAQNVEQRKALQGEIARLKAVRDDLAESGDAEPVAETSRPPEQQPPTVPDEPGQLQCPPAADTNAEELARLRDRVTKLTDEKEQMEKKGEAKFRELWRKLKACERSNETKDQLITRLRATIERLQKENDELKRLRVR